MKKIYRSYRKKNAPQAFLRSCLSRARVVLKGAVCERARQIPQRDTLYFHFTQMRKFVNPFCMIFCCGRVEAASLERGAPAASGRPAPKKQKQNKKRAAIASFRLTAGGLFLPAPHGSLPRLADRGQCSSVCRNFVLPTDGRQPLCPLPEGASSSGRMRSLQAYIAYHTGERAVKCFRGVRVGRAAVRRARRRLRRARQSQERTRARRRNRRGFVRGRARRGASRGRSAG